MAGHATLLCTATLLCAAACVVMKVLTWHVYWHLKVKPWLYSAAMICGSGGCNGWEGIVRLGVW